MRGNRLGRLRTDSGSRHVDFHPDSITLDCVTLGKSLNLSVLLLHHLLNYIISERCYEDALESTFKSAWLLKRDCKHVVIIVVKWTELRTGFLCWKNGGEASMAGGK